jgi:hypothetical protein
MPSKLKLRLLLLALNILILVVVFITWRPPKADAWIREPTVLNETWYGPALLILVPVLLYWTSRAIDIRPIRTAGFWLSLAALMAALYVVNDHRTFHGMFS